MPKFVKFMKVRVINPNTQESSEKLRVVNSEGMEYDVLTDMPIEDIKANRDSLLEKVIIKNGSFKPFAVFRMSEILEEF